MHRAYLLYFLVLASPLAASNPADLPKRAIEKSQLTLPGSRPFHLKAEVVEATNPENDSYKAEIEEYWVSPNKWRRTIKSENFTETLIVNGDKTREEISGGYYPNWLRTIVAAMFNLGDKLQGVDMTKTNDNPRIGGTEFCRRFVFRAGVSPVNNNVYSSFCFQGDKLSYVARPGYNADYKDFKKFGDKEVARRIREHIESGTELEAKITELTELTVTDNSMFAVTAPTKPLQTININEETLRMLAGDALDIHWPPVRDGKTEGVLSLFVCLDRDGHVRETYGLNSDHPDMTDAARKQLSNVQFKPADFHGDRVQVEGILTFAYKTKIVDPYPELSDDEARKLAIKLWDLRIPSDIPRGTIITLPIFVGDDGKVHSYGPFKAGTRPLNFISFDVWKWQFRLPEKNGKPTAFKATLKFVAR